MLGSRVVGLAAVLVLAGCVDGFRGSNVQFDFAPTMSIQAPQGQPPLPGQLPSNIHFRFYGIKEMASGDALFEVTRFEIHRIVDLTSPCFIDVGPHVPYPGLHVTQYAKRIGEDYMIPDIANPPATATEDQKINAATAVQRMNNVNALSSSLGISALTSTSTTTYPAVGTTCAGPGDQIPPAMCSDDASNTKRLALCQAIWKSDPDLFEGTDRVLTAPLNGTVHGMVDGLNPINQGPVGGAQFFSADALIDLTTYAIYWQYDDADHDGLPDYPASVPVDQRSPTDPGTLMFFARATTPTRGALHLSMTSTVPQVPAQTVEVGIFTNLGSDDGIHF